MSSAYATLDGHVEYVLDTGPFLCLGAAKELREAFRSRSHGKTHWARAVHDELRRHSRGHDLVLAAAARPFDNGPMSRWLPHPVEFEKADADVAAVLAEVRRLAEEKRRKALRPRPPKGGGANADLGEAQSIVLAGRTRRVLMSHDDSAREAARNARVPSVTLVDLARRLVADGTHKPRALASAFQALTQSGIEIGARVAGPLDLQPAHR